MWKKNRQKNVKKKTQRCKRKSTKNVRSPQQCTKSTKYVKSAQKM